MARRLHSASKAETPSRQVSFLSPEEAEILHLVRENLRLLAEIRPDYATGQRRNGDRPIIRCARDVFELVAPEMEALLQEQLKVVLLDSRNHVIDVVLVYLGNVRNVVVRTAELLRDAVITNAPSIILVHNHPSGEAQPSPDDVQLTKDAAEAAKLLGIELLDHVIIGHGRFVSLKDQGIL